MQDHHELWLISKETNSPNTDTSQNSVNTIMANIHGASIKTGYNKYCHAWHVFIQTLIAINGANKQTCFNLSTVHSLLL
jgi:hypothetical protein